MFGSTVINIWQGFSDLYNAVHDLDPALADKIQRRLHGEGGEVEFHDHIGDIAEGVDIALSAMECDDFPSVWAYDVAPMIGEWIIESCLGDERMTLDDAISYAVFITNEWVQADGKMHLRTPLQKAQTVQAVALKEATWL